MIIEDLKPSLSVGYNNCNEENFFIQTFGYDNFDYVKPIKIPRIQHMYTLHLVLKGEGTLILNNQKYSVKEKDLFFIPPGVSLCYYPDDKDKWKYIWFEFVGETAGLYEEKMGFSVDRAVKNCKGFDEVFYEIYGVLKKLNSDISVEYYEVLSLFYKLMAVNLRENKSDRKDIAETAVSYINCHYHDTKLTIDYICRDLKLSHSHFCRLFKKSMGMSAMQYLVKLRIEKAAELLEKTDLSVKEVSCSVGFNDCLHFMKSFKKYKGISAGKFRKNSRTTNEKMI